ncbi:MAG TPA: serine hydrolase domain-containing protein [Candidatus Sulfotelmatobacter sp.]|nr:serine hydrolase domain-containing protein [Candidatus Sulfotelmatobacter sp.]
MIAPLAKLIRWPGLLVLAASLCHASASESNSVPKSIPDLQTEIESVLQETKTPGAAIAIVSRDRVEWLAGIGKADVAANRPVTTNTLFRLGSISKSVVAVAALQLQEQGKLKLTDTMRQWLPDVPFANPWEATNPVRLVHLLEHTSGFDDMHFCEYALDDPTPMSLKDALAVNTASRVCRWPPGTRMAYCSSGPGVMAAVIEKASGERFEDYVQEHIFKPLHMNTADYFYTPRVQQQLARLYHSDGITPYPYWHIALRPTAALNASVSDMANYLRFYLQRGNLDGAQVLQPASIQRMETTETMPSAALGDMINYGLSNYPMVEGPYVFRGHNGAVMGGTTQMAYLPDQGRGYIVMLNSGNFNATFQIGKLLRQYITRNLVPPALPPVVPVQTEIKQHYGGYYQLVSPDFQWSYGLERLLNVKKLTFTADGLSGSTFGFANDRWVPMSERLFRDPDESLATLALLPDAEGQTLVQCGFLTFEKISGLEFWAQTVGMILVSVLVLSALFFAPVWIFRRLFSTQYQPGPLSVRAWPLVSAALLLTFDALLGCGFRGILTHKYIDDVNLLGAPTYLTIGIMLASIAFPVAAVMGLYAAVQKRKAPMKRIVYWHSVLVVLAMIATAIYYGYWGLIGLRLWA